MTDKLPDPPRWAQPRPLSPEDVVLRFFKARLPAHWRLQLHFSPINWEYELDADWKTEDGQWLMIRVRLPALEEKFMPEPSPYEKGIMAFAKLPDPEPTLSARGIAELTAIANHMIEQSKRPPRGSS